MIRFAKGPAFLTLLTCATTALSLVIPRTVVNDDGQSVKLQQHEHGLTIGFEAACNDCFEREESDIIFELDIARTENVCGESDIHLNGQQLNFTWDGINAIGGGVITCERANGRGNIDLSLDWRSLCIASPDDSVEDYSAQILTLTFSPADQIEGNETSGFAVSFNPIDDPTVLRLVTSPIDISDDDSSMDAWLNPAGTENLQVQENFPEGHIEISDLEEELKQLQKLKEQAEILDQMIKEKDRLIRAHLFKDCSFLTHKLKECNSLKCFVKTTFKLVPDIFRLMKYRFGPLPSTLSGNVCQPSSQKNNSGDLANQTDAGGDLKTDLIPQWNSTNITNTEFKLGPSGALPYFPHRRPQNQSVARYFIRNIAVVCLVLAVLSLCVKRFRNSMAYRRRRVDIAARREERCTRRAYRAAACRHEWRQWWHSIIHPGESNTGTSAQHSLSHLPVQQECHNPDIDSASDECSDNPMPNEILSFRRVLEYVGDLVRSDEPSNPNLVLQSENQRGITEISANRFLAGTPAPSSTAPLTTIGSPRTSTILSYETDSLDTIDSLDPDTATMTSR